MVIFDAHNLNPAWTKGEFRGTKYGLSDKGWINTELFETWLSELFLQYEITKKAEQRARKAKEMAEKKAKRVAEKTTRKAAEKTTRKTVEKTNSTTLEEKQDQE